ncbi:hypothetical protein ScPMuIL_003913 [Solemya velum]
MSQSAAVESTCSIKILLHRYQQERTARNLSRSSRPRVTTLARDRFICLRHLRQRSTTAFYTTTQIPGLCRISSQTVISRLREAGLSARRPHRSVILTDNARVGFLAINGVNQIHGVTLKGKAYDLFW